MPKVYIKTFGCQMNRRDSEIVEGLFAARGWSVVQGPDDADVILVNTCSVRKHAVERAFGNLLSFARIKKANPALVLGLTGCVAQEQKEEVFRKVPEVDFVCAPSLLEKIPGVVEEIIGSADRRGRHVIVETDIQEKAGENGYESAVAASRRRADPVRSYVSIIRGCDNFCSYCVVPYVRGREISRPVQAILDEVKRLADSGCREITLLGQNVNSYVSTHKGRRTQFPGLLALLNVMDGILRIRFETSHPKDTGRELMAAMRDLDKVCESLHLPAQSGSDRILKAMNRRYTCAEYRSVIEMARDMVPGISVTTDIIVGFPSESEEDFQATRKLLEDARFDNSFVFKYSPRPFTNAGRLPDDVPLEVKEERNRVFLDLQERVSLGINQAYVGRKVEVLAEGPSKTRGRMCGRTRTNKVAVFEKGSCRPGDLVHLDISAAGAYSLVGKTSDAKDVRSHTRP